MQIAGPSLHRLRLGDLALYEGRITEASRSSRGGGGGPGAEGPDRAADKFAALAYVSSARQQRPRGPLRTGARQQQRVRFGSSRARVFIEAGRAAGQPIAAELGAELQAEPQAYAVIEGGSRSAAVTIANAIKLLTEANTQLDTWIGHFDLGRVYLAAGAFPQADSEFDRCIARRGEALALFLDEEPTFSYFPAVYYYQGRVREGLKTAGYVDSYRAYLDSARSSTEDPLVAELRKRVATR